MNAITRLWQSVGNLAEGLNRLAALANTAADTIEGRLVEVPALQPPVEAPALANGDRAPRDVG